VADLTEALRALGIVINVPQVGATLIEWAGEGGEESRSVVAESIRLETAINARPAVVALCP